MKKFEILQELPKCDTNELSKCWWENGTDKLVQHRAAIDLQLVKKKQNNNKKKHTISKKWNKAECNKMSYAGMYFFK